MRRFCLFDGFFLLCCHRSLLKQLVTMEVILWTVLWNEFEGEFNNEKNLLGGSLGEKAAEDLRQRVIEHVSFFLILIHIFFHNTIILILYSLAEHTCHIKILLEDHLEETCRSIMP